MNTANPILVSRPETISQPRRVEHLIQGRATSDGAGVKLTRVLTHDLQQRLDPYLMLDAFRSDNPGDYIGGFPEHPHRGFEAITTMIAGRMRHRDSAGHEGLLQNGGVQWMIAGSGLMHSELPEQEDGLMEGFQLWLNLPAQDKMSAPTYRDIPAEKIPTFVTPEKVQVRVIASTSHGVFGVQGAVSRPVTEPVYLDVFLPAGTRIDLPLAASHNAFLYTYRGQVDCTGSAVPDRHMAILSNEPATDGVRLQAAIDSRVLLIAGKPLHEPIAQHGPFVMNTPAQIEATLRDYRAGKFNAIVIQKEGFSPHP